VKEKDPSLIIKVDLSKLDYSNPADIQKAIQILEDEISRLHAILEESFLE
jgi:hypothetical protein